MDLVFLGKHRHFWSWSVCAWFNRHFLTLLDYLNTIGGYSVLPWRHRRKFAIRMNVFFSRTSSQIIWNTLPVFVFICSATSLAGPISEDIIHSWASLLFLRCLSSFPPHHFLRHTVGLSLPGTFLNAVTELFFTILSYQNVLLCFLDLSLVYLGAHTTRSRHEAQGRSPAPLQYPLKGCSDTTRYKGPRAQANHCVFPPGLVFPVIHPTQHSLLLLSWAVVPPACVWLKWIHKAAFWQESGHMDSIFCTHVDSFSLKHDFTICFIVS